MEERPNSAETRRAVAILGIDNVPLDIVVAQAGSRVLAASIDYLLLALLQLTLGLVIVFGAGSAGLSGTWIMVTLVIVLFLVQWGFFAVQEIAMHGRTLGKSALGLRVVSRDGGKAGAAALVVRNLIRSLDLLFGMPLLLVDRRARRLGDLVAGTLVVHERTTEERQAAVLRLPAGWGGRHAAVAEAFLERAELMEPERARRIAERILAEVAERDPEMVAEAVPAVDPVATLRHLLAPGAL